MVARPLCTYCAKPAIDHLGFNQYCSPRATTTFTTDRLIKRATAVGVIAGMIGALEMIRLNLQSVDLTDPKYTAEAEQLLDNASS